ncbi:hypothetical protein ACFWHW_27550 [Streptomyces pharetrae]|uniref:hypothetical protein n=1 Tax=Streptomyces pharetrae TaxID=291370 RepID=UPI00364E6A9D
MGVERGGDRLADLVGSVVRGAGGRPAGTSVTGFGDDRVAAGSGAPSACPSRLPGSLPTPPPAAVPHSSGARCWGNPTT